MRVVIGVCAAAALVSGALMTLAVGPSSPAEAMIDFSTRDYRSVHEVQRAFARSGVRLHESSRFGGFVTLTNANGPLTADKLTVVVAPRRGNGSWGPKLARYDVRFDNLLVTYDHDDALLERVERAVGSLH